MAYVKSRSFMWGMFFALVLALVVGSRTTNTASVNFANDVNAAIDAGIARLAADGAYNVTSNCGDAAGLCALVLLEKRVSADPNAAPQGYANANATDKGRLDNIIAFIITSHTPQSFYAYRDGADLMALSVYLRTGGPNQAGAGNSIRAMFDRVAANQGGGYWCYTDGSCDDSSTTQLVMAGLAAARAVFSDPAYADPARLASLNTLTLATRNGYAANGLLGEACSAGGILEAVERGHGYNRGNCNSHPADRVRHLGAARRRGEPERRAACRGICIGCATGTDIRKSITTVPARTTAGALRSTTTCGLPPRPTRSWRSPAWRRTQATSVPTISGHCLRAARRPTRAGSCIVIRTRMCVLQSVAPVVPGTTPVKSHAGITTTRTA